jgi:hypothetical protein
MSLDKAWTYRKASFSTPGIKTIFAVVVDGRRVYGTATQVSVQNFNIVGQKSIVLFIGDALGTAYRDREPHRCPINRQPFPRRLVRRTSADG